MGLGLAGIGTLTSTCAFSFTFVHRTAFVWWYQCDVCDINQYEQCGLYIYWVIIYILGYFW